MRTKSRGKNVVLAFGVLVIAAGGFAGGLYYTEIAQVAQAQSKNTQIQSALWTDGNPSLIKTVPPPSFSELAKSASPAVVFISTKQKAKTSRSNPFPEFFGNPQGRVREGLGSGFIINEKGHILTNNHVIDGADEVRVTLENGEVFSAKVIGADPKTDVALIKIKTKKKLPVLSLGNSLDTDVGDWVVAIGNPFGLDHTVTAGIVSAKGRARIDPGGQGNAYHDFIQTDASINPGNSGGPLLNVHGEVIGINTAINAAGQGIGFAIPIRMVKDILPQLAKDGKVSRSWMGVTLQPVTPELYEGLGLSKAEGVLISNVIVGGPADKAGIQVGDVIVSFAGKPTERLEDLRWFVSNYGANKRVEVGIIRKGSSLSVYMTLKPFPSDKELQRAENFQQRTPQAEEKTALGLSVQNVDSTLASRLGVSAGEGVYVVDVDSNSPADGRILPGDIILSIGERAQLSAGHLKNTNDFEKNIKGISTGKPILAYVLRGGQHIFVAIDNP